MADSSLTSDVPDPLGATPLSPEAAPGTAGGAATAVSDQNLPEVLRVPTIPVSWTFRGLLGLASLISGITSVAIKQLLLPSQTALIDPNNKVTSVAIIAAAGGVAALIAAPLAGAFSDRTVSRFGRRRPWIVGGLIMAVLSLLLMAFSTSIPMLLVGDVLEQISVDFVFSTLNAVIPDKVPPRQRAVVAAFVGMSPIVGGVVGLVILTRLVDTVHHPEQGYYVLAVISVLIVGLLLLIFREKPLPRGVMPPFKLGTFLARLWVSPKQYPDFGFVWLSRCCTFLAYALIVSWLFYYLQDSIKYGAPDQGVTIFQIISTGAVILAAVGGGILADKMQRLKLWVSLGALIMMAALLLIAFVSASALPALFVGAAVFGLGFGVYLAVDLALAIRVLPAAQNRAKDLGIMNMAIFLAVILSPILGGAVLNLTHNNYMALFSLAALSSLLAALLIVPVKSVR